MINDGAFIFEDLTSWGDKENQLGDGECTEPFESVVPIVDNIAISFSKQILEFPPRRLWAVEEDADARTEELIE